MKERKHPELMKLKGKIREQGHTYRSVSATVGISTSQLSNKINGYSLFDIQEVAELCKSLDIPPEDISRFFLTQSCET